MKKLILFALILVLSFGLAAADRQAARQSVIVYAALDERTSRELLEEFTRQTGIQAELAVQLEQAGTIAARIETEASNPRADVFIGGNSNIHDSLSSKGLTYQYRSPVVQQAGIDPIFMDVKGYWTGWYMGGLCILYNTERYEKEIKPLGLEPPATWEALLNPAYQGEVIASNPATTGGAYLMMAAQIFRLGSIEAGFDYIRELNKNVALYTTGANGSIPLVSQGEAIVGFAWGHDTLKQKVQGNLPITVVFPEDTGFEIGAGSIIKGSPNTETAKAFIDFLLSPEAGAINARNGYRYPVRGDVDLPTGVPSFESLSLAPWDFALAAENVDAWTRRWAEVTGR